MADIFGCAPYDYPQYEFVRTHGGDPLSDARERALRNPLFRDTTEYSAEHNFNTEGTDNRSLKDNLVAIQAQVDKVGFAEFQIDQRVPVKVDIADSDSNAYFYHHDISNENKNGSIVRQTIEATTTPHPINYWSAVSKYSSWQINRTMKQYAVPLPAWHIESVARECYQFISEQYLWGQTDEFAGLLNQPRLSSDNEHGVGTSPFGIGDFEIARADHIVGAFDDFISGMVEYGGGAIGRQVGGRLNIGLPPHEMSVIATRDVSDDGASGVSIQESVEQHNPWLQLRPDNTLRFSEIPSLDNPYEREKPRIVAWVNSPLVMEFAMPYAPRVSGVLDHYKDLAYVYLEFACGPGLYVKDARGLRYGDGF